MHRGERLSPHSILPRQRRSRPAAALTSDALGMRSQASDCFRQPGPYRQAVTCRGRIDLSSLISSYSSHPRTPVLTGVNELIWPAAGSQVAGFYHVGPYVEAAHGTRSHPASKARVRDAPPELPEGLTHHACSRADRSATQSESPGAAVSAPGNDRFRAADIVPACIVSRIDRLVLGARPRTGTTPPGWCSPPGGLAGHERAGPRDSWDRPQARTKRACTVPCAVDRRDMHRAPGHAELRAVDLEFGGEHRGLRGRLLNVRGEGDRPDMTGRFEGSLALQLGWARHPGRGHGQDGMRVLVRVEEVRGAQVLVTLLVLGVERAGR